jgi:hypothetical protein
MRQLKIIPVLGAFVLLLAGCSAYHLGPANKAIAGERTVEVAPFNNQTLQPRLGDAITQNLREQLQQDGTFRLATSEPGDIVVTGLIKAYTRVGLSYLNTDAITPQDFRVEVVVHVTARDRASGKLLIDKDVKGHTLVNIGSDLASSEREALPLLAEDLNRNITELLTEGSW